MKPVAYLVLGLLFLVTGCSRPAATPQTPPLESPVAVQPAPIQPAPPPAQGCRPEADTMPSAQVSGYWNALHGNLWVANGTCSRFIHVDLTEVSFRLPLTVTQESARAALQITGDLRGEPHIRFAESSGEQVRRLTVRLPDGQAGDRINVRLEGPVGKAGDSVSLGFELERRPAPTITAEIRDSGGNWVPLPAGGSLQQTVVDLRFQLHGGLSAEQVAERLQNGAQGAEVTVTRQAPDVVEARAEGAPARLFFSFAGVQGADGLSIGESALTLYLGAPPRVVALTPPSNAEEPLVEAPVDVELFSRSPDGQWVLFKALDPRRDFAYGYYLAGLTTGKGRWLPVQFATWQYGLNAVWEKDRLLLPDEGQIHAFPLPHGDAQRLPSSAENWGTASPDGKYLLGWQIDPAPWSDTDRRVTATLVLRNLQTGEERRFPSAVVTTRPFESPPVVVHTWAGDGKTLVMRHVAGEGDDRIAHLDLLSGQIAVTDQPWPHKRGESERWVSGPAGWQYLTELYPGAWHQVQVQPAGGGPVREYGEGMPLGWTAQGKLLVLRWDNLANRRPHSGH